MVPQGNDLPKNRLLRRRGSLGAVLIVAVLLTGIAAPIFALCTKTLYAGILVGEARTVLEASATSAFPCLSAARLGRGIGETEMAAFREMLEVEVQENMGNGPLSGCVLSVDADLESAGTVSCTLRYRPGTLGEGLFGEVVPQEAEVSCRVDLPVEP